MKRTFLGIILTAVALLSAGNAVSAPIVYNTGPLVFNTDGQSIWGTGESLELDKTGTNAIFIGEEWTNEKDSIDAIAGSPNATIFPEICLGILGCTPAVTGDTRTGFEVGMTSSGKIGFELGLKVDSGTVDSTVSYGASLTLPDPRETGAGDFFNLNPDSTLAGVQSLETTFPTLEASASVVLEAKASFFATGCFIGLGCSTTTTPEVGVAETLELVSFNQDGMGGIEFFDGEPVLNTLLDVALATKGLERPTGFPAEVGIPAPGPIPSNLATITASLAKPDTSGGLNAAGTKLTSQSSGDNDLLDFLVDVDNLVSIGLTGVGGLFGGSTPSVAGLSASYDLVNVELGPTIDLEQSFELTPTLMVTLDFDQLVRIAGLGDVMSWTGAWDSLPDMAMLSNMTNITPTFFLQANLWNKTFLDFDVDLIIDVLTATVNFSGFGSFQLGVGNVFEGSQNLFSLPPIVNSNFAVNGWNRITGPSFLIAVPEPGTVGLMLIGLLGFGLARKRKR